jgi:hypothetical protein
MVKMSWFQLNSIHELNWIELDLFFQSWWIELSWIGKKFFRIELSWKKKVIIKELNWIELEKIFGDHWIELNWVEIFFPWIESNWAPFRVELPSSARMPYCCQKRLDSIIYYLFYIVQCFLMMNWKRALFTVQLKEQQHYVHNVFMSLMNIYIIFMDSDIPCIDKPRSFKIP